MAKLLEAIKSILGPKRQSPPPRPSRGDPQFVGRSSVKEIEQASPERVGELVGHPVERVDT